MLNTCYADQKKSLGWTFRAHAKLGSMWDNTWFCELTATEGSLQHTLHEESLPLGGKITGSRVTKFG